MKQRPLLKSRAILLHILPRELHLCIRGTRTPLDRHQAILSAAWSHSKLYHLHHPSKTTRTPDVSSSRTSHFLPKLKAMFVNWALTFSKNTQTLWQYLLLHPHVNLSKVHLDRSLHRSYSMMCTTTLFCILAAASYTASASSKHTSPQRIPNAAGTNACGFDVRTFLSSANLDLVKDPASVSKLVPFLAAAKNAFSCSEIICEEMQIENLCFQ